MSKSNQELKSETAAELDLTVIRYSRVFEDHRVLSEALDITADSDTVLSITSSGDNVLNLLLDRPRRIVAVDMSVAQNSILELKLVAIRYLSYHDYLVLLGETDDTGEQRLALYEQVKEHMPTYAQEYWHGHTDAIKESLCICSRLLKNISKMCWAQLSPAVGDHNVDKLFNAQSLPDQRQVFTSLLKDKIEPIMRSVFKKENQKSARSAVQLKYVDETVKSVEDQLWERFSRMCQDVDIRDNFYLSWFVRAKRGFNPEASPNYAPPFLTEEGFIALKGLVDRVGIYTGSLESYLSKKDLLFSKANLSDIFEYMSVDDADRVFSAVSNSMSPGGRVAYWDLYNHRLPSANIVPNLQPLTNLSKKLYSKDRMFFYSMFWILEKK